MKIGDIVELNEKHGKIQAKIIRIDDKGLYNMIITESIKGKYKTTFLDKPFLFPSDKVKMIKES